METDPPSFAVLDTFVLVNFLSVDRVDLLSPHPVYRFVLTGHVQEEVTDFYPEQVTRLKAAMNRGGFDEVVVESTHPVFVRLNQERRLGLGEAAAIAYAVDQSLPLAIEDPQARKAATAISPAIILQSTESLVVDSICYGVLDIPTADRLKERWEQHYRFRLPFRTFADRIPLG